MFLFPFHDICKQILITLRRVHVSKQNTIVALDIIQSSYFTVSRNGSTVERNLSTLMKSHLAFTNLINI